MRKIDPNGVWEDFAAQISEQSAFYARSWRSLPAAADRKVATENFILTLGVAFEGFVNDLVLAYANRDCTKVMEHLEAGVRAALASNFKAAAAFEKFAEFKRRRHISKAELKDVLDPTGRNTSFPDFAAIEDRARQWLVDAHRDRFVNLTAQQKAIINALIAFRNNLAHRSPSSLDRLNDVLEAGPLYQTGLQRGVNRVRQAGNYLKARHDGTETRAAALYRLLHAAAHDLVL